MCYKLNNIGEKKIDKGNRLILFFELPQGMNLHFPSILHM